VSIRAHLLSKVRAVLTLSPDVNQWRRRDQGPRELLQLLLLDWQQVAIRSAGSSIRGDSSCNGGSRSVQRAEVRRQGCWAELSVEVADAVGPLSLRGPSPPLELHGLPRWCRLMAVLLSARVCVCACVSRKEREQRRLAVMVKLG
jgi:hypothetical protein